MTSTNLQQSQQQQNNVKIQQSPENDLSGGLGKSQPIYSQINKKPTNLPSSLNGYKISPKPSATVDHNFDNNFVMNRKIQLNGGNEIRIDDKNISLHLNNPFVTNFVTQHQNYQNYNSGPINSPLRSIDKDNSNGGLLDYAERPKRPHSIAVSSPHNNNDLKTSTLNRKLNKDLPEYVSREQLYVPMYGRMQVNPSPSRKSEFNLYAPPSPITNQQTNKIPPPIVQRRSQSTPRPLPTSNLIQNTGINGVSKTNSRPRSLDRCNGIPNGAPPVPRRLGQLPSGTQSPHYRTTQSGIRHSQTFHGQQQLRQSAIYSYPTPENGDNLTGTRRKDRPASYAYGTLPDQVYLENQLRVYSEQLKTITESVRKYSEQAKILSELKKQQLKPNIPISKSDSKIFQKQNSVENFNEEAQTPSHQLKLFLDNIRSSMSSGDELDEPGPSSSDSERKREIKPIKVEVKTPSDQLRQFLDQIRSNQVPEDKPIDRFNNNNNQIPKQPPRSTSESFSQVTDNLRIMNQDLEGFTTKSPEKKISSKSMDFNQILDNFHQMANSFTNKGDSIDYLKKCSDALKQTSDEIKLATMFHSSNYNGGSPDDSSCSTTPGSVREAVQNLLSQPRNGFQIMDDRMRLFIDILDSQEKFSQVKCYIFLFFLKTIYNIKECAKSIIIKICFTCMLNRHSFANSFKTN